MSLRVLSESLTKVPVKEKQYIITTVRELDEKMLASYNKMKTIREKVEDIQSQWKSLQEDLEGVTFARYITNGTMREQFQKAVDDLKLEYDDAKSSYLHYKELKNKVLTENTEDSAVEYDFEDESDRPVQIELDATAPVVSTVDVDSTDMIHALVELLDSRSKEDLLDFMFSELVPESGCASTLVGELVRALMHILYVKQLSSQKFYQDQGLSYCGGAAQFLMDNGYEDAIVNIVSENDDLTYTDSVMSLAELIARDVITDSNLLCKQNTCDSRNYANDRISNLAASFDYTIYLPYFIVQGIEDNKISYGDVCTYLKDKLDVPETITIEDAFNDQCAVQFVNISRDMFEYIDEQVNTQDIFSNFVVPSEPSMQTVDTEYDNDDLLNMQEDAVVLESVEATNINLNEENDTEVQEFLALHDDPENYKNNKYGFDKLYELFDSYGFSSDEDVDICFMNLSDEDKELALQFIRKR